MARVILTEAGEDITVGGDAVEVFGTTAGGEEVTITGGNVTLDASFNRGGDTILLANAASAYTAQIAGGRLVLTQTDADGEVVSTITLPVSTSSTSVSFDGDVRDVRIVGTSVQIGDQIVPNTGSVEIEEPDAGPALAVALANLQDALDAQAEFAEENPDAQADLDAAEAALAADIAAPVGGGSRAQLAADVSDAQDAVEAAEEAIADVDGLAAAIEDRDDAVEAAEETAGQAELAFFDFQAQVARFEFENRDDIENVETSGDLDTLVVTGDFDVDGDGTVQPDEEGVTIFTIEDGEVTIEEGFEDLEGIDDLVAAAQAAIEAGQAAQAAETAAEDAQTALNLLDPGSEAAVEDLEEAQELQAGYAADLEAFEDALEVYNEVEEFDADVEAFTAAGTEAATETNFRALLNAAATAGTITTGQAAAAATAFETTYDGTAGTLADAIDDAQAAYADAVTAAETNLETAGDELFVETVQADYTDVTTADFEDEALARADAVDAAEDALTFAGNPLADALTDAQDALEDAQGEIIERNELEQAVEDAQAIVDQGEALADDVADAQEVITDLGYEAPVLADGLEIATAESDIFVENGANATIRDFGEEGEDRLFIGQGYTVVELEEGVDLSEDGEDGTAGSATTLEIFIQQDGDDTIIWFENSAFAGSDTTGDFDGNFIVLQDVDAGDVALDEFGFITVEAQPIA